MAGEPRTPQAAVRGLVKQSVVTTASSAKRSAPTGVGAQSQSAVNDGGSGTQCAMVDAQIKRTSRCQRYGRDSDNCVIRQFQIRNQEPHKSNKRHWEDSTPTDRSPPSRSSYFGDIQQYYTLNIELGQNSLSVRVHSNFGP